MNSKVLSWSALVAALVAVVLGAMALVGVNNQSEFFGASGSRFPNGISANNTSPVAGEVRGTTASLTGRMSVLTTGTTTTSFRSSSATQGYCVEFNATSSDTVLNRTYAASTTPSTAGVISVVRYGACN